MADVPRPHWNILLHMAAPQRQRQQHPVHFLHLFMRVGLAHDTQLEAPGGEGHGAMGLQERTLEGARAAAVRARMASYHRSLA